MGIQTRIEHRSIVNPGYYSSNHVLVNRERTIRGLVALRRVRRLDQLARKHAESMAQSQNVQPSVATVAQLKEKLQADRVGENTVRGDNIRDIHNQMMTKSRQRHCRGNLLAPAFDSFGMGTAMGADGKLYLVQLFCRDNNDDESRE